MFDLIFSVVFISFYLYFTFLLLDLFYFHFSFSLFYFSHVSFKFIIFRFYFCVIFTLFHLQWATKVLRHFLILE